MDVSANDNQRPRCVSRADIERDYGFSPATFSRLVARGVMPARLAGTRVWDRAAINRALDRLSGLEGHDHEARQIEADLWFLENAHARAA